MEVAVKLEIFEGPLDLLLHLIRKNEVDIYDIPVALITRQYLDYLDLMRDLNITLAGEFLVMASTLTHLKSRMLLPVEKANAEGEEGEDPRQDLVSQLKEHMRFRAAAEGLEGRPWLDRDVFARPGGGKEVERAAQQVDEPLKVSAGLFDLIAAFHDLMRARGQRLALSIPSQGMSIEDRMTQLIEMLRERETISFFEAFDQDRTRGDLVVTFLALLELTRVGLARVYQDRQTQDHGLAEWGTLRIYFNVLSREEEGE